MYQVLKDVGAIAVMRHWDEYEEKMKEVEKVVTAMP